ncbi:MAG: nucleotide exchange factor GrpE [Myxococcota bacterium]
MRRDPKKLDLAEDAKDPDQKKLAEEREGWEALTEDDSGGALTPSSELEEALEQASVSIEARHEAKKTETKGGEVPSADKMMLEALSNELQSLKAEYESKTSELDEHKDRFVRLQADFENVRRRGLKDRQEAFQYGHQNLVKDLLSSVDNLDRAIEHAEQSGGGDLQSLLRGVDLVRRELLGALGKHGVNVIETEGHAFDPEIHEAMAQTPDASVPVNTIMKVLQKGYRLRDRMLRPARVVVSRLPEAEESGAVEEAATPSSPASGEAESGAED